MKRYIFFLLLLASCTPATRLVYAPAVISTKGGKVNIVPSGSFQPMPDTVINGFIVKRLKGTRP